MSELERLAERCERASGPDRELGADILRALGWTQDGHNAYTPDGDRALSIPDYTASLDAAMTLVPEDMRHEIEITTLYRVARVSVNLNHGHDDGPHYGSNECNSIPLALTAAALRARARTPTDGASHD